MDFSTGFAFAPPGVKKVIFTTLPFGPRISFTAWSVGISTVSLSPIFKIKSPDLTPALYAGLSLTGDTT